jgi:hypothetical protein
VSQSLYRRAASTMLLGVLPATVIFWSVVIWTQEDGVPMLDVMMNNAVPLYVLSVVPALIVSAAHTRLALVGTSAGPARTLARSVVLAAALGLIVAVLTLLVLFGQLSTLMWPAAVWGLATGTAYGAFVQKRINSRNAAGRS